MTWKDGIGIFVFVLGGVFILMKGMDWIDEYKYKRIYDRGAIQYVVDCPYKQYEVDGHWMDVGRKSGTIFINIVTKDGDNYVRSTRTFSSTCTPSRKN